MKGHTGATLSLGKGGIYSGSWKQKLVARSSTKSELIGVYDVLPQIPAQCYWKEMGEVLVRNEQSTWTLGTFTLPNKLEERLSMSLIILQRKW